MAQDSFIEDTKEIVKILTENKESTTYGKKPLKDILSSYFKEKVDDDLTDKLKKEFLKMKLEMQEADAAFSSIMDIQKRLVDIYNSLKSKK